MKIPTNSIASLGDYINAQREEAELNKRVGLKAAEQMEAMKSLGSGLKSPELGSQFAEGPGPSLGGPDVKQLDIMPGIESEMKSAGIEPAVDFKTGSEAGEDSGIGGDVGGAAIMAGASALKGILKAKAEKEAIEFQKKREMTESQSKAQQKTAARGMGAGVQNMQQLIANFRASAR
jgi:hypothetical protein